MNVILYLLVCEKLNYHLLISQTDLKFAPGINFNHCGRILYTGKISALLYLVL